MQDFTDLAYTTSPQDKESTEARIKRDASDLEKMHTKITLATQLILLRNMVNRIVAGSDMNMHAFQEVGNKIIRDIKGKSVFACTFKRKDRAKTLGNSSAVKIADTHQVRL
ncbi:hypothetical protein DPMN_106931 [Dreissena polymorpha]|uniref:Uncharacterized protein n=1 Tax=Dreissena polymorpha TaxID=45954 RepID=A0A9D4K621_DREPO|nr:hypothetical protein DPMN_106931 [Dreissena polymorpha]